MTAVGYQLALHCRLIDQQGQDLPLTTFWTTKTVDIKECLLKALVAYAPSDATVWPSKDVQNDMRKILFEYVSMIRRAVHV